MTTTTDRFTLSPPPTCVDGPPDRPGVGYAIALDTSRGLLWFRGFGNPNGHWSTDREHRVVYGSPRLAVKAAKLARIGVDSSPFIREVHLP